VSTLGSIERRSAVGADAGTAPVAAACRCAHCGLDVPSGLVEAGAERQFCCHGCRTAYSIIHSCGLDRYYSIAGAEGAAAERVRASSRSFVEFNDPAFRALYITALPGGLASAELYLSGVHCAACVWLVERLPRLAPGVVEARLDFRRAIVRLTWDESRTSLGAVAGVLDSIGYTPHPARDARSRELRRSEDRRQLARLAVAGCCAGNVMLMALAMYAGLFDAMDPGHATLFRWTSMGVTLVSLAWPGAVFFRSAWAAIRTRAAHIDVPIALALAVGGLWSVISTVRGVGEVYFDTVSVLVFALLVGRFLQSRQQRAAADSVELLFALTPASARVVRDGECVQTPMEGVKVGDTVEVHAGESFPVDGTITSGASLADLALLTGESRPVRVNVGDAVHAGTVNLGAAVRVLVAATGEQTRVGALTRMVGDYSRRRAPIVQLADRAGRWFTIGMLALAMVTFAAWAVIDPARAVEHAVALLVVTCPCALGLATPLTLTVALGRAAREGMLVKGGDALQKLSSPGVMLLDKTGTITTGRLSVVHWEGDQRLKTLAAALESTSNHPIAVAIARALGAGGEQGGPEAVDVHQTLGGGVEGTVHGRRLVVGSPEFVRSRCTLVDEAFWGRATGIAASGFTPVAVACDGRPAAWISLGDTVRPDAPGAIAKLQARGWDVRVLSGDHADLVREVAARSGIRAADARGDMSPEAKAQYVRDLVTTRREAGKRGPVVMVGDGVNDAAALACADVGVAVHGGAEASLAAADAYLTRDGLAHLVELSDGCARTMRTIRRNLGISIFYNATAATLAVLGLVGPLLAALVMPISSLTVVGVSLRARTFERTVPAPTVNPASASRSRP
jgi:Cu2+-exporting ATPase